MQLTNRIKGQSNLLEEVCSDEVLYHTGNYTDPVITGR